MNQFNVKENIVSICYNSVWQHINEKGFFIKELNPYPHITPGTLYNGVKEAIEDGIDAFYELL